MGVHVDKLNWSIGSFNAKSMFWFQPERAGSYTLHCIRTDEATSPAVLSFGQQPVTGILAGIFLVMGACFLGFVLFIVAVVMTFNRPRQAPRPGGVATTQPARA